jgi:hypothetical protein
LQKIITSEGVSVSQMNGEAIKDFHIRWSQDMWEKEISLELANALLPIIKKFLGPDLMVQYYPYFRVARPFERGDNIGYHKDTHYGQTPYELAVHIPFVDLDDKSAIRVISGTHLLSENVFEKITVDGKPIKKGDIENLIGRPYFPRYLKVPDGMGTIPLVMKVGQAAIFSPAIFHGQEVNEGDITRLSCDIRFVNSCHSNKVRVGKVHAGYVQMSESPVERIAKKYYEVNP